MRKLVCSPFRHIFFICCFIFVGDLTSGCTGTVTPASTAIAEVLSLTPNTVTAGNTGITLHVTGKNFAQGAVLLWNGKPRPTAYLSRQSIDATIPSTDLAQAATIAVSVLNEPQGSDSKKMTFTITAAKQPLLITTNVLPSGQKDVIYAAALSAHGGTLDYHWSVTNGTLPPGINLDSQSGTLSGNPMEAGNFGFTVRVEDSSPIPASAEAKLVLEIALGPSITGTTRFYGPGLGSDGLGNTTLGPNGNMVSYRLRVKRSGRLVAIHPYLIMDHPGYYAGTGGTVLVSIQPDDGTPAHNPSGTKLASSLLASPLTVLGSKKYFPVFQLSRSLVVTQNELIHVVFENTDPTPEQNYVSVDSLYQAAAPIPSQPTSTDIDCAVLVRSHFSSDVLTWKPRQGYTPIVQFEYDDGSSEGVGYMEAWVGAPESISGQAAVRESFTVSESAKDVTGINVRVARISGDDSLVIRLEKSGGILVEQGTVRASLLPLAAKPTYMWVSYSFTTTHRLEIGQTYHLVLASPASTIYQTFPIRKGLAYGFQRTTFFSDGFAQLIRSGSWVGWTQWGVANRSDGDLQFYFTTK